MMATYKCNRCGTIYEPGPNNMIERTIIRYQRYTSTIAGEIIYWLCPECREKFENVVNNFVYGMKGSNNDGN